MNQDSQFDYIIAGCGCAGLSLAMHMIHSKKFTDKKILLVDEDYKNSNDRTWCFWEKEESLFSSIIYKEWDQLLFYGKEFSRQLNISPYKYKMIRGIDFYMYCFEEIKKQSNFSFLFKKIENVFSNENTGVVINGQSLYCTYVFNSILFKKPKLLKKQYWMLQHFKGWTIETEKNYFTATLPTLMDFRIDQQSGTAFFYVLPLSPNKALIEYTLFSNTLLQDEKYNEALKAYIQKVLKIDLYKIIEEEFGTIPMTNATFSTRQNNIINIGTAGGQTKASSGYTFNFIQKHSDAIVQKLTKNENPFFDKSLKKFTFYDSVLINILYRNVFPGHKIFTDLFKKNKTTTVFKFLDNETSLAEDVKIISSLPAIPFLKAALHQLF